MNARFGTGPTGDPSSMAFLGFLVLGAGLALVTRAARHDGEWYEAVLTGALAAGFGGVVFVTARQSEIDSFFSPEGWLVAGVTALVGLALRAVVVRPSEPRRRPAHRR